MLPIKRRLRKLLFTKLFLCLDLFLKFQNLIYFHVGHTYMRCTQYVFMKVYSIKIWHQWHGKTIGVQGVGHLALGFWHMGCKWEKMKKLYSWEFQWSSITPHVCLRFWLMSGGFIKIEGTTVPKLECHVLFINKRWIYSSMWLLIGFVIKLNIILEERFDTNAMKMSSSGFWLMFWQ